MYNNFGLFKWNKKYCGIVKPDNIYNNVFLHTGKLVRGQWQNSICVTDELNEINIIENSNHFIHFVDWGEWYNAAYQIYDNIVKNYTSILNTLANNFNINLTLYNDATDSNEKLYFYMIDAFSFSNSGHNLSVLLDQANYIIQHNVKDVIIFKGYKEQHNFKLIQLILPNDIVFHEIDFDTIYKFKKIIILFPEIHRIKKHPNLINQICKDILAKYYATYIDCTFKNIILMKTNRNQNVMLKHSQINCENFLQILEKNTYINIIPENIDIFQLAIYLLTAKNIISSTGSVIYTNSIFIDTNISNFIFVGKYDNGDINSAQLTPSYVISPETVSSNNDEDMIKETDNILSNNSKCKSEIDIIKNLENKFAITLIK